MPKIQNYVEALLPSYLTFLFRQLDNNDANDDKNDIDIFPLTDKHTTYKISQTKLFCIDSMNRSEFQITVSHQLSAAILLLLFQLKIYFSKKLLGTVVTIF